MSSEAHVSDPIANSSLISQPTSGANATKRSLCEKGLVSQSSDDRVILSARDEDTNAQAVVNFGSQDDLEEIKFKQAAIKAQAAFRGYQVGNCLIYLDIFARNLNIIKPLKCSICEFCFQR